MQQGKAVEPMDRPAKDTAASRMIDAAPRTAFYGRRVGKALRGLQQDAIARLLPRFGFALADGHDPSALFPARPRELWLEIGCGCGEHLLSHATRRPELGFIGVEPFINGLARTLVDLEQAGLANVRLFDADAALLLDVLPQGCLSGADLFYPDPWPKRRHWKRRFIRPDNLGRLARAVRPGGTLRVASDVPHYVGWTLAQIRAHGAFAWTAQQADDWRRPFPFWPGTRYEAKALADGRIPTYLAFTRL